jgi:hypothetical protein
VRQMAVIRNVGIGSRDVGSPVLWFNSYVTESSAALQVLSWDEAYEVLKSVYDVKELEGKPCWVDVEGGYIKFQEMWK